jgi:hypothetical protein
MSSVSLLGIASQGLAEMTYYRKGYNVHTTVANMTRIEHFTNLDTNIDSLYNSIKEELNKEKNLKIVSEIKGEMNGMPLRSITAVNKSLVVLAGALRDISVSIIGHPNDYAVEVTSSSWFESLLIPGITGFIVGGPFGAVSGTTVGLLMAYQYERKIWKKIRGVINRESKRKPAADALVISN